MVNTPSSKTWFRPRADTAIAVSTACKHQHAQAYTPIHACALADCAELAMGDVELAGEPEVSLFEQPLHLEDELDVAVDVE